MSRLKIITLLFFLAIGISNSYAGQEVEKKFDFVITDITLESSLNHLITVYGINLHINGHLPNIKISTKLTNATVEQALKDLLNKAGIRNSYFITDKANRAILLRLLNHKNAESNLIRTQNNLSNFLNNEQLRVLQQSLNADYDRSQNSSETLNFEQIEALKAPSDSAYSSLNREFELLSEEHKAVLIPERPEDKAKDSDTLTQIQIDKLRQMSIEDFSNDHSLTPDQIRALNQTNKDNLL